MRWCKGRAVSALAAAAVAALCAAAHAGGWGLPDCSADERAVMTEVVEACAFEPFRGLSTDDEPGGVSCPGGCACKPLGARATQMGEDTSCLPVAFFNDGGGVQANPECVSSRVCACPNAACHYSCADTSRTSCYHQYRHDRELAGRWKRLFSGWSLVYVCAGAAVGLFVLVGCVCCCCCH